MGGNEQNESIIAASQAVKPHFNVQRANQQGRY